MTGAMNSTGKIWIELLIVRGRVVLNRSIGRSAEIINRLVELRLVMKGRATCERCHAVGNRSRRLAQVLLRAGKWRKLCVLCLRSCLMVHALT